MPSRSPTRVTIFDGATANGTGVAPLVNDFKTIHLQITTSGNAALTARIQGSFGDPALGSPDFGSAASPTNPWDYVAFYDYRDPTTVTIGTTGLVLSGTDVVRNLLVNVEGLAYVNIEISGYSAGVFSATSIAYNNQ